jgi:hypothetical protein
MMYGRKYQCVAVALLPCSFPSHTRQCLAVGSSGSTPRLPWSGFVSFNFGHCVWGNIKVHGCASAVGLATGI